MDIKEILDNYKLSYKEYYKLEKGYATDKWIIIGTNDKKYVLKQIIKQTEERLEKILYIQSILLEYAPSVLKTKTNKLYVKLNDKLYYMCEYIESKDFNIEIEIENIGKFLGSLHIKMESIKNVCTEFLKVEDNREKLKEYLEYHKQCNNIEYIDILEYKLKIINEINKNECINYKLLSKQIIHGDFYTDNILLVDSTYKIIDFDQCCNFYIEYEVLRAMMMISSKIKSEKEKLKMMKKFVNGYISVNKIVSPINAYNLYLYVQANSTSSLSPTDYTKKEKISFAKKRFDILKFLVENKEYIISILGGDIINEKTNSSVSTSIQKRK